MEDSLGKRVVGQDLVLSAFGDAVGISRAGLQAPNRLVASFLFLRPIGVAGTVRNIKFGECVFNDLFVRRNNRKHSCLLVNKGPCEHILFIFTSLLLYTDVNTNKDRYQHDRGE